MPFLQPECITRLDAGLDEVTIGASGPVLEHLDGSLQEAGGFINVDGSTIRRNQSNFQGNLDELAHVSTVDYVSAACLLIRRTDFGDLAGFDPVYEPAYNEDTDLCCRLRATGKQIALVRDARAIHLLNATLSQLPPSDPVKGAPLRSHEIFRSRWRSWLWTRDPNDLPDAGTFAFAAGKARVERSSDELVHAVISSEALRGDPETHAMLTVCTALAHHLPTLISTRTPYSTFHLLHLMREFSLPTSQVNPTDQRSLAGRSIEAAVLHSCEIPPPVLEYGKRRILYCPDADFELGTWALLRTALGSQHFENMSSL